MVQFGPGLRQIMSHNPIFLFLKRKIKWLFKHFNIYMLIHNLILRHLLESKPHYVSIIVDEFNFQNVYYKDYTILLNYFILRVTMKIQQYILN